MSVTVTARPPPPEDEHLGVGKDVSYGLQHVLTMYGGIIAPPLIVGAAAGVTRRNRHCSSPAACSSADWRRSCNPSGSRSSARACRWCREPPSRESRR